VVHTVILLRSVSICCDGWGDCRAEPGGIPSNKGTGCRPSEHEPIEAGNSPSDKDPGLELGTGCRPSEHEPIEAGNSPSDKDPGLGTGCRPSGA